MKKEGPTKPKLPFAGHAAGVEKTIPVKDWGDAFRACACKPGGQIIINNGNKKS